MANIFVRSRPTTNWAAATAYVLGDRRKATAAVLGKHFECTTAGTSHATTEPTWDTTVGNTTADGTVTWTCRGSANTWVASTTYVLGDRVVATTSSTDARRNYVYECTTAGTSGGTEPVWITTTPDTSTTSDGTVTWTQRKCTTWNNAHITLESVGLAVSGTGITNPGDTIYVGDEHLQTRSSALILSFPGTRTNPNNIICVNDTGDPSTPTSLATTAKVQTTGASAITLNASTFALYYNGIQFQAGDSTNNGSINVVGTSRSYTVLENCLLELRGSSVSAIVGSTGQTGGAAILINTPVKFANASQGIQFNGNHSLTWKNTPSGVQGTAPTTLFPSNASETSRTRIHGVDLSTVTGNLISNTNVNHQGTFVLSNCKLGAGVSIPTGTNAGLGNNVISLINCDSGATNTRLYHNEARGTIEQETTIVRTGGASDGTTPLAWKMVSLATLPRFSFPLASFPIVAWNDTTGSAKTLTVEIVNDGTTLTDAEVWVEVEYPGTSGFPISSFVDDAAADILATPANQTSSSETWTTTGLSSPVKQKLSVSFTPQLKGPVSAVVYLARPSKTIYVDPVATIS